MLTVCVTRHEKTRLMYTKYTPSYYSMYLIHPGQIDRALSLGHGNSWVKFKQVDALPSKNQALLTTVNLLLFNVL